jgi:general secretion pathway protein K
MRQGSRDRANMMESEQHQGGMKMPRGRSAPGGGFALILVMITILALTALVATFAVSMNTEVRLARNADYDDQMEWMGRSGIELARFALANKCPEQRGIDALNQFWAGGTSPCSNQIPQISLTDVPLGMGKISVSIVDMERKWDINQAADPRAPQRDVLQKALTIVGVTDPAQVSTIEDSLIDWRNPNGMAGFSGAKDDYYNHLKPPYYCKNGPIDDLSELLLVKGITPEIYWGSNATNHPVSAYQQHGGGAFDQPANTGGAFYHNKDEPMYPVGLQQLFSPMGGRLNINTASSLTLQLIPGVDEGMAQRIIQQRAGPDGIDGTEDDAPFVNIGELVTMVGQMGSAPWQNYIDVHSLVFDVQVTVEINGYKRLYHGILSRHPKNPMELKCVKFYWD